MHDAKAEPGQTEGAAKKRSRGRIAEAIVTSDRYLCEMARRAFVASGRLLPFPNRQPVAVEAAPVELRDRLRRVEAKRDAALLTLAELDRARRTLARSHRRLEHASARTPDEGALIKPRLDLLASQRRDLDTSRGDVVLEEAEARHEADRIRSEIEATIPEHLRGKAGWEIAGRRLSDGMDRVAASVERGVSSAWKRARRKPAPVAS